jgi:hypothetical protein
MTTIASPKSATSRTAKIPMDTTATQDASWKEFQYQDHSLSINASEAAVCAGFHEYKCVPKLLCHHVYQGPGGQALLQHDACLLGLQLVSEEEQLLEIAVQAGQATTEALSNVFKVQRGEMKIETVEKAKAMRQYVVQQAKASQQLTNHQLAVLEEKTRYAVDTGCGHSWENEALDQYERQCGWEVTRRNEECRIWHFEKCKVAAVGESENQEYFSPIRVLHRSPSIRSVGPAVALDRRKRRKLSSDLQSDNPSTVKKESTLIDLTKDKSDTNDAVDATLHQSSHAAHVSGESSSIPVASSQHASPSESATFFLSIKGMVDGIRDELVQRHVDNMDNDANDDDNNWVLRSVIVECKHRMNTILPYPRLYECIQAVIYCQMYGADDADIIQVLRTGTGKEEQESVDRNMIATATEHLHPHHNNTIIQDKVGKVDNQDFERDTCAGEPTTDMKIAVSRISLEDHFQHLHNWRTVILPRLRAWADAVYRIRQSDELRYRLLNSIANMQSLHDQGGRKNPTQLAWELAFEQCPFLRDGRSFDCYKRQLSNLKL